MRRLTLLSLTLALLAGQALAEPLHGIAMHGTPALPADYKHFPYVNPDVKKGGKIAYGVVGTYDSLNPFNLKSIRTTARGMWDNIFGNLVYESLTNPSPFTGCWRKASNGTRTAPSSSSISTRRPNGRTASR